MLCSTLDCAPNSTRTPVCKLWTAHSRALCAPLASGFGRAVHKGHHAMPAPMLYAVCCMLSGGRAGRSPSPSQPPSPSPRPGMGDPSVATHCAYTPPRCHCRRKSKTQLLNPNQRQRPWPRHTRRFSSAAGHAVVYCSHAVNAVLAADCDCARSLHSSPRRVATVGTPLAVTQLLLDMVCLCGEPVHAARLVRPGAGHPNREHVRCSLMPLVALPCLASHCPRRDAQTYQPLGNVARTFRQSNGSQGS